MSIVIDISDEVSPYVKRMLEHNQPYLRYVLKSIGYFVQQRTKREVAEGSPGGKTFAERAPYDVRRALDRRASRYWYGKMRSAFAYEYENEGYVAIGWASRSAARYGRLQEYSFSKRVSEQMRKHFAVAGVKLSSSKQMINVPARPVFEPIAKEVKPLLPSYVENKLLNYMSENVSYAKTHRRRYRV